MFDSQLNNKQNIATDKYFLPLLALGILVNASGLFTTILDSDGTLYATIAKTIAQSGDFVNLKVSGKDWLDKPHLPFWLAALSYKIFGYTSFAYKLPAFVFWALGARYTYLFAKQQYSVTVAQIATLIYVSATHLVISNNDVRAEPYLTGMIIGSVYHFYCIYKHQSTKQHLLLGCLLAALAVMTKGPFVLITIGAGFVLQWLVYKEWEQFLRPIWWMALALIGVLIFPEIYCLYAQFDAHPEKLVFDTTGVSGIKFFFWDSQFGRFFNNGPIKGEGDYFFFVHTLLWAFLPWCFLLYPALVTQVQKLFTHRNRKPVYELVTLFGGLFTLLIFSLSKFQLPHYTNILFPFFAIVAAQYIHQLTGRSIKWHTYLQMIQIALMLLIIVVLWYFLQPLYQLGIVVWCLITIGGIIYWWKKANFYHTLMASYWTALCVYAFLNLFFYPTVLQYQAGSNAATYINKHFANKSLYAVDRVSYSLSFYTQAPCFDVSQKDLNTLLKTNNPLLVYCDDACLQQLEQAGRQVQIVKQFPYFHVSQLNGTFLNHQTRYKALINFNVALVQ